MTADRLRRIYAAALARGDRATQILTAARLCALCGEGDCEASLRENCRPGPPTGAVGRIRRYDELELRWLHGDR
jgi:hypothetical protein